ncbi:DNA repair protein RecN [Rickettsiales bacterium]|nr:DNA repair protein RecN [Rickettsiales bacterium]
MLLNINIQNIVLIEKLNINFNLGLCVLSGETGSGKSILLDALGLAIGNRSNYKLLRKDCKSGMVAAQFHVNKNSKLSEILLENSLTDEENENIVTLKRILYDNLTSKSLINDIPVSVNLLKEIGSLLIEIHGQNEQQGLLNNSYHLQILDQFAKNDMLLKEIQEKYQGLTEAENELKELRLQKDKNEKEIDYLTHIISELELANIQNNEEEDLRKKYNTLKYQEKINNTLTEARKSINDSDFNVSLVQKNLINSQNLVEDLGEQVQNDFNKIISIIDDISIKNEEIKEISDNILYELNANNDNLQDIEERLFLIKNLCRKFNKNSHELDFFLKESQDQLNKIINFQEISNNLEENKKNLEKEFLDLATKLSNKRQKASLDLSKKVENELQYLKMGNVKFLPKIQKIKDQRYNSKGVDEVRFLAKINQSSDFSPISKIASGGELSRFMLSLKVALLDVKSAPILIFDEIDAGIGGAVANAVGERLKLLANNLQVIVVTHHAQVAAKSSHHLLVKKQDINDKTNTTIKALNIVEKEKEIARMISGEKISNEALMAAKKLMIN